MRKILYKDLEPCDYPECGKPEHFCMRCGRTEAKGEVYRIVPDKQCTRYGRFNLSAQIIRFHPELVAQAFAIMKFVPTRAEMLFAEDRIEYTGMSELFDEVEFAHVIPDYELEIVDEAEGVTSVQAHKKL